MSFVYFGLLIAIVVGFRLTMKRQVLATELEFMPWKDHIRRRS